MELSELKDEEKIALYKKVREKYSWCTKPENIARLAKVELTKLWNSSHTNSSIL